MISAAFDVVLAALLVIEFRRSGDAVYAGIALGYVVLALLHMREARRDEAERRA